VVGVDEQGNIMHQVQPGDTVGGIALLYGYSWDDIPALLELNGMTDARELEEGAIFLVPPYAGTYTPTASNITPSATPTIDPAAHAAQLTADAGRVLTAVAFATYTVTPLPRLPGASLATVTPTASATVTMPANADTASLAALATAAPLPSATFTPSSELIDVTSVAMVVTPAVPPTGSANVSTLSPWVIVAIVLQVGVLVLAGGEYLLRGRRKRR
jgi:hypothetical protein